MCITACLRKIVLLVPENFCLKKVFVVLFSSSRQITEQSQTGRDCACQSLGKELSLKITAKVILNYEGWNFNSGNYLFTTDTK